MVELYVLPIWPKKTDPFLSLPSMESTECSSHTWIKFMDSKNRFRPKNCVEIIKNMCT